MSRLAHLGLGGFFRAHQAWYTARANERDLEASWTYTAFSVRSTALPDAMTAADNVYTLVERAADGDRSSPIASVTASACAQDTRTWRACVADPELAVLTLTVTESGYDPVTSPAPGLLLDGLADRRRAGAGPLALVSCDNLAGNGEVLRGALLALAAEHDRDLARWIDDAVAFPSTMVDRITPHSADPLTVVTEPFSEWVLAGSFPAGRPAWDEVGAQFVDDVAPYERRKLWLLNAGHTTLAYLGLPRGLTTVAEAYDDPGLRAALEELWREARAVLDLPPDEVDLTLAALRTRFANPRIEHRLAQIARSGHEKLAQRQRAISQARVAAGLDPGQVCRATIEAFDEIVRRGEIRVD